MGIHVETAYKLQDMKQPFSSAQHFWRCSQNPDPLQAPLQDRDDSESSGRDRSTPPFCEGTFPAPSSRPGIIHSASLQTHSLLQCLDIKISCYNQSCLFVFYRIFMSFPGAVDLISSQSNGTWASLSGLSLGEAALQKCVRASPTETPFFMSFTGKELIIVLKWEKKIISLCFTTFRNS